MAPDQSKRFIKHSTDVRLLTIGLLLLGSYAFISYKLFEVQVVDAAEYQAAAERQLIRVEETAAARGTIYDREGRELAVSIESRSIYANPTQVKDPSGVALILSSLLDRDLGRLREKLSSSRSFEFLARQVDIDVAARVEALELEGIHFLPEPKRVYPSGPLAAHVVGFVNIDSKGIEGLESAYDDVLTGTPGRVLAERAAGGQVIPHGRHEVEPAIPGADLILSIDREIQFVAHHACVRALISAQAERCTVIAMNPDTFEILAMVVTPSFDPSDRTEMDIATGRLTNIAVRSVYEPGSTQKAVTVSAAIEESVVDWDTEYLVQDEIEVVDDACQKEGEEAFGCFSDFSPHDPVVMTVKDCVQYSSNVCTVKIGRDLGEEHLAHYLDAFGYGQNTGIDYPGESGGSVNLPHGCPTCPASASIGYSLSVTPLQMASFYSTIANGGLRLEPRLVIGTVDGEGVQQQPPSSSERVISARTARTVRLMLKSVVDGGTGTKAAVKGYTAGGKTGTTRKFDHDRGAYTDDYVASFVGMAPVDHPRLVIVVVIDSPRIGTSVLERTGGAVAAPVFAEIMERSLHQMGVSPDA